MPEPRIVLIGASTGGFEALQALLAELPGDVAAALFIDVHDRDGRWYSLRVCPYNNLDNRIDGAGAHRVRHRRDVRRTEERIARTRTHLMNMLEDAGEPILVLSQDRRVAHANRAFQRKFGPAPERLEGSSLGRAPALAPRRRDHACEGVT